ncbi:ABC transporter ATP-binding protein [Paralimibaculum aggregatum]|uniref:ABC transporter ATP-binding protein n=1 Tax=Paralimibaculum aggregatum TaxID=3036245 RepID=A0ABQ6LLD1_9RHOB|nr:ABC transporter ATP-binding protein [Limibaculum sp. NKW23]GMG83109.1 ABC transporter ATP-binding protein [Limibaculum sp. NKW23]
MLSLNDIWVHYGPVAAVKGISLEVEENEIVTLIGANGAGKTTTMRTITGLHHPTSGEVRFCGERIDRLDPEKINALGIAMVPEGRRVFPQMTVMENLEMGAYLRSDTAGMKRDIEEIFGYFPILEERQKQLAGTMSGGQQQMVAMARALMSGPRLLLLDEPSLGLSPIMSQQIAKIIKALHQAGRTIVLVEQNARLALLLAKHAYVMETGSIAFHGLAEDLRDDPKIRETYLGV